MKEIISANAWLKNQIPGDLLHEYITYFWSPGPTLSSSLKTCSVSGRGWARSKVVVLKPGWSRPTLASLSLSWFWSSSRSRQSFSTIQLFSLARESNFSFRKSLVLSYSRFWVRWSLERGPVETNCQYTEALIGDLSEILQVSLHGVTLQEGCPALLERS